MTTHVRRLPSDPKGKIRGINRSSLGLILLAGVSDLPSTSTASSYLQTDVLCPITTGCANTLSCTAQRPNKRPHLSKSVSFQGTTTTFWMRRCRIRDASTLWAVRRSVPTSAIICPRMPCSEEERLLYGCRVAEFEMRQHSEL